MILDMNPPSRASASFPFLSDPPFRRPPWPHSHDVVPGPNWLLSADAAALSLRLARDRITLPLIKAAASFVKKKGWSQFGFARLDDHARERFGCTGRSLRDLAALGRGLSRGPELIRAISGDDGRPPIGRVAARFLLRVSTKRSLSAWLRLARCVSVRKLRDLVREAREKKSKWPPGEDPKEGFAFKGWTAADWLDPEGHPTGSSRNSRPDSLGDDDGDGNDDDGDGDGNCDTLDDASEDPGQEDQDDDRVRDQVILPLTPAMLPAFDEGVDLYHAVVGTRAPVASFIEGLVAEASGGSEPPNTESPGESIFLHRLVRGTRRADAEQRLARSTRNWEPLPATPLPHNPDDDGLWESALGSSLERLREVSSSAGYGEPAALDRQIRTLLSVEDELDRRLGRLLAHMSGRAAWTRLRFTGVEHYAEQRLGMSRTSARERVMVERGLRKLPIVREAYEEGIITKQAAVRVIRTLSRTQVDEATEHAWVERAHRSTIKRLDDEVRLIRRARKGAADPDGGSRRQVAPLDDATWHDSLRREPGTARERLTRLTHASLRDSAANVFLRLRLAPDLARDFLAAVEDRRAGLAEMAAAIPHDEPLPRSAIPHDDPLPASVLSSGDQSQVSPSIRIFGRSHKLVAVRPTDEVPGTLGIAISPAGLALNAARTFSIRGLPVPSWVGLLSLLEEFIWTWDDPDAAPKRRSDAVYNRDGWRCMAPGCTSRSNLEDHHVIYRSRGGSDGLSNRVCICRFYHKMGEHGHLASCRGTAPLGLNWSLGRMRQNFCEEDKRKLVEVRYRNEIRI